MNVEGHRPFLAALLDEPSEPVHLAAYADWLSDEGEETMARVVRAMINKRKTTENLRLAKARELEIELRLREYKPEATWPLRKAIETARATNKAAGKELRSAILACDLHRNASCMRTGLVYSIPHPQKLGMEWAGWVRIPVVRLRLHGPLPHSLWIHKQIDQGCRYCSPDGQWMGVAEWQSWGSGRSWGK